MKIDLTTKQKKVLEFITEFIKENSYPPSIKEICTKFGYKSPKAASDILQAIENKGYISRVKGRSRSIKIIDEAGPTTRKSSIGSGTLSLVVAGDGDQNNPLSIFYNSKEVVEVPKFWASDGNYFVVRVVGSGLNKDYLEADDIAICKQGQGNESNLVAVLELGKLKISTRRKLKEGSLIVGEVKKIIRDCK